MVHLKVTVNGNVADIEVHIVGERLHPDFRMRIALQEGKIVSTDATGSQEWFSSKILHGFLRRYDDGEDIAQCKCIAWY